MVKVETTPVSPQPRQLKVASTVSTGAGQPESIPPQKYSNSNQVINASSGSVELVHFNNKISYSNPSLIGESSQIATLGTTNQDSDGGLVFGPPRNSRFFHMMERLEYEKCLAQLQTPEKIAPRISSLLLNKVFESCRNKRLPLGKTLKTWEARNSLALKAYTLLALYFGVPALCIPLSFIYLPGDSLSSSLMLALALGALGSQLLLYSIHRIMFATTSKVPSTPYSWILLLISILLFTTFCTSFSLYLHCAYSLAMDIRKYLLLFILIVLTFSCFFMGFCGWAISANLLIPKSLILSLYLSLCCLISLTVTFRFYYEVQVLQGLVQQGDDFKDCWPFIPIYFCGSICISSVITREMQLLVTGWRLASLEATDWAMATYFLTWSFTYPAVLARLLFGTTPERQVKVGPSIGPGDELGIGINREPELVIK